LPIRFDDPVFFDGPAELRAWLEANHAHGDQIWIGLWKVGSGKATLTWPTMVDELLAFGWIDGLSRSIDGERWMIRATPRKAKSPWSEKNLKRMPELIAEGRIAPAGMAAYEAREDKTPYSYERTTKAELTAEEEKQFDRKAAEWFAAQAPSYRKACLNWVTTAKQAATRERRLATLIEHSREAKKLPQFDSARYKSKP
jgi:uncharacterized protein YdeI (YjbR/CyaY-like superfamily)